MRNLTTHLYNKSKQYLNRIFYSSVDNVSMLFFNTLLTQISVLDSLISSKLSVRDEPHIVVVSSNLQFKIVIFLYCIFTNTNLLLISPKFNITEIVNTILSKRNINVLFVDQDILMQIKQLEREEGIHILNFFKYIGTTYQVLENLEESSEGRSIAQLAKLGRTRKLHGYQARVSILSPGTTSEPSIVNIPHNLLIRSAMAQSYFMGLKKGDKVSVIADFEFFPSIYTILGFISGIHLILPTTDHTISSHEELQHLLSTSENKPDIIIISSGNFKKIWDSIMLKVYSKVFMIRFSKYWLTGWIPNYFVRKEVESTFGESVKKVHIQNEELGFYALDILKKSKIMFSSSYGFLEQGNFLAFKKPEVFKHKNFIYKPGGTLLVEHSITIDDSTEINKFSKELNLDKIILNTDESSLLNKRIFSNDIGTLMENVSSEGTNHPFLYVYSRSNRYVKNLPSLDLMEKSIKDNWLIRDCFFQRHYTNGKWSYFLFVEIRDEVLDSKRISFNEAKDTINALVKEFDSNSAINITHYSVIQFNGMRNVAGRLQYYNM